MQGPTRGRLSELFGVYSSATMQIGLFSRMIQAPRRAACDDAPGLEAQPPRRATGSHDPYSKTRWWRDKAVEIIVTLAILFAIWVVVIWGSSYLNQNVR
jgi:hypothetical protein